MAKKQWGTFWDAFGDAFREYNHTICEDLVDIDYLSEYLTQHNHQHISADGCAMSEELRYSLRDAPLTEWPVAKTHRNNKGPITFLWMAV